MKSQDVERKLEHLGASWPADASIVDRVMRQIESRGVHPQPPAPPRRGWNSLLAAAAVVALVAMGWWVLSPADNSLFVRSLYARALEAMENARTIHMTTRAIPADGQPKQVVMESWFERGVGFRVDVLDEVRLGKENELWIYRKKDNLAIRSENLDLEELIDRELDLKHMLDNLKQFGFKRSPEADETLGGRKLTAYLLNDLHPEKFSLPALKREDVRAVVLMDTSSRIVLARQENRRGGRWVPTLVTQWLYDVPVDRRLFDPKFGDDVRIADGSASFDELTSLDEALYKEERRGIILAIHRLQRFAGNGVFVVSSVRAAPAVLEKYPLTQRFVNPGQPVTDGPARNYHASPQNGGYFRINLASVGHNGVDLCWWVLLPRGTNAPPYEVEPGKVKLPLAFTPQGGTAYGKTFVDEKNQLRHVTWDQVVDLGQAENPPTLDSIADQIYADMKLLYALPFRQLYCGVFPGTNTSDIRNPDAISAEQYRAGAERNVMLWYERDLEFQLKDQFKEESRRQAVNTGTPAIGLSYNPLVDDLTLAEIARRTSIERLYLDGTKITDNGLRELAPLNSLHELSLINTPITDSGLKHLERLSTLKKLYLHGTQVTPAAIAELVKAIPGLKVSE